jgi:hypothetical protein
MSKSKRYYVTTTLVITAAIIGLGIWGYYAIIQPIYLNNASQTQTKEMQSTADFEFAKYKNQGDVYGIEIEITGNTASNFDLVISNGKQDVNAASVKGKNIDFIYVNDWIADSCFIQLKSHDQPGGKVTVTCRFLALD